MSVYDSMRPFQVSRDGFFLTLGSLGALAVGFVGHAIAGRVYQYIVGPSASCPVIVRRSANPPGCPCPDPCLCPPPCPCPTKSQ